MPLPESPPPGPFRAGFWRSRLRGPWLASMLSAALLPLILICAATGFLSHVAYEPDLGDNSVTGSGGIDVDLYFFDWPTTPSWLYALTQGLHVISGVAAIPILLAKLWTVIPKLFTWPPVKSLAHGIERFGLALLVGGSLLVFATGVMNVQLWYPFPFSFVPVHYYAAFIFLAALAFHIALLLPVFRRSLKGMGVKRPLAERAEDTEVEPSAEERGFVGNNPRPATISRRGLLATVAAGSVGLGVIAAAQSIGGPLRSLALLAPRRDVAGNGPNDFQVNKAFASVGIREEETGAVWRLQLVGGTREIALSRDQLLALPQATETLPIACVEGWSTTQTWTGVRLSDLTRMAGAEDVGEMRAESLQPKGAFRQATLSRGQMTDSRSLLALKVNGEDLSLDHGFPARIIVPALPGVHNTKWVSKLAFA